MRQNGTLNYLLGDHLGSTSLTTDANGTVISEMRYKAWGEVRYSSGNMPTKYTFTGQYSYTSDFGLMFYNARWLDVSLGRFAQADTIVPGGSQGLDRYAYVNNAPVKYTDPSGHVTCQGKNWDDGPQCKNNPSSHWEKNIEIDRQDWLFARAFRGSGKDERWTADDWRIYHANRDYYWANPDKWIHPDPKGLDGWVAHARRLASYYGDEDKEQFVRDFALLFGGVPYYKSVSDAAIAVARGPKLPILNESSEGLASDYLEGNDNQSHHYAGLFFAGYYTSPVGGFVVDYIRDAMPFTGGLNPPDMYLGAVAAEDGWNFRNDLSPSDVPDLLAQLSVHTGIIQWRKGPIYIQP